MSNNFNIIYNDNIKQQKTIASLVAEHFLPNYDPNKNVKHIDKDKSNYKIDNLFQKK